MGISEYRVSNCVRKEATLLLLFLAVPEVRSFFVLSLPPIRANIVCFFSLMALLFPVQLLFVLFK